jgi:hypothetical protein
MCGLWEQIMAAFNVVPLTHFVAEGRGQDFADLVDELLSRNIWSYDAVAEACILGLSKQRLSHDIPCAHASWTSQICTLLDDTR